MKRNLLAILSVAITMFLTSCSGDSYLNAIPGESNALISMDMGKLANDNKLSDKENLLKTMFHVDDMKDCGLDLSEKLYLFESPDGNLGVCAKVDDSGDLEDWLTKLSKAGICKTVTEHRGFHFTVLKDTWVVGFSDDAFLVMGPVVGSAQDEMISTISKYLKADEDEGIKGRPIFDKLDSIPSAMAMVAQAKALPAQFVAPFTLGAPKGTDASQVLIAAEISVSDGCMDIKGETFSFNKGVDAAIKKASTVYRPIKGKYVATMPQNAFAGIFVNVEGTKFLPMMQTNKGIQAMLAGINSAIDMDNIIRSVNGDMTILMPTMTDKNTSIMMGAQLANSKWLADVDYWKQSCPKGGRIIDSGKNAFYYTDGTTNYFFGVTPDLQYFSGSNKVMAENSIKANAKPISKKLQQKITGQKLVMVINAGGMGSNKGLSAITSLMSPIFGKFNSIVYSLK